MRFLKIFAAALFLVFILNSCQKELNFDYTAQSNGTLKSDAGSGDCLPITIHGDYQSDSALINSNYIDVQVDVTSLGQYEIYSDTINGYFFRGTGRFGMRGLNTVRLYGFGRPSRVGVDAFTIHYKNNTSSCVADIEVVPRIAINNAVYSLGGAGGSCSGAILNGTYVQGLALASNNTLVLNITLTSPGAYSISTPTINGVTFSGSGFLSAGATTVTLFGTGTPLSSGIYYFPVTGAGSSCNFSVSFLPSTSLAVFTLGGAPNNCTGATLSGAFDIGVPMNSSNSVVITVNVSSVGSYSITTANLVGIVFSATGVFTSLGTQNVTLFASGTPNNSGVYVFPILNNAGGSCSFTVSISGTPADFINCKIDGVYSTFNINASAGLNNATGFPILSIDGSTNSVSIYPSINLQITKSLGGSIMANTYNVNQLASGISLSCTYYDAASTNYSARTDVNNQSQSPPFTIVVTSISSTRVVGTFFGPVKDNAGLGPITRNITEGAFNVAIR